jgi:hypothetical protein
LFVPLTFITPSFLPSHPLCSRYSGPSETTLDSPYFYAARNAVCAASDGSLLHFVHGNGARRASVNTTR